MASQLATFAVVVGIALLLAGFGFAILAFSIFRVPAMVSKAKESTPAPVTPTPQATA